MLNTGGGVHVDRSSRACRCWRQDPGQVGREATAGDVRQGVHVDAVGADEVDEVGRVDPSGFEQLLAQGATELVDVPVERPADVRHDAAHERVAVGVQAAAGEGEHDVTGSDPVWAEHGIPLDDTGRSARDVVLVGLEESGVLGRLAADERDPGLRAGRGDPRHDGRDPLGHDAPARDVVGHEQRLRAADDDVVDDHADEVEADRVVPVEGLGDRDLGADAVGGGGEHRVVEALERGGVEHPGEPAEAAEHLGAGGARDAGPHQLDGPVAGLDVDAGTGVRDGRRLLGVAHAGSLPAA